MSEQNTGPVEPVRVVIHARARQGQIERASQAFAKIAAPIRENADCLEFRIYQDRNHPADFVVWERWIDMEALIALGKTDYMAEYHAQKDEIFESMSGDFFEELHPGTTKP